MKYLLDTNACINLLRGRSPNVAARLQDTDPADVVICSVVVAELLFGAMKSAQKEKNLRSVEALISSFGSLAFDDTIARQYARLRCGSECVGKPIGPNDLVVASIAGTNQRADKTPSYPFMPVRVTP